MSDEIELEQIDGKGRRVTVSRARWERWPSLHKVFRPVAEKKAAPAAGKETTPVVIEPPTGDGVKENES
jgi:hypothetical protein